MHLSDKSNGESKRGGRTAVIAAIGVACLLSASLVAAQSGDDAKMSQIERGKYLVNVLDCTTCHTPWTMTPNGPRPDSTKFLSGHPSEMKVAHPKLEMPWLAAATATFTAWAGPWGISFAANLTPDSSGLGVWDEAMFLQAFRTGKHWGVSRPIMPPMPWEAYAHMPDEDFKAIFAYLKTIPPVKNVVPDYEPPAETPGGQH